MLPRALLQAGGGLLQLQGAAAAGGLWQATSPLLQLLASTPGPGASASSTRHAAAAFSTARAPAQSAAAPALEPAAAPAADAAADDATLPENSIPVTSMEPLCPLTYNKRFTPRAGAPLLAFDEVYIDASNLRAAACAPTSLPGSSTSTAASRAAPLTAVFLHGLLGSGRNWRSFARRLALDAAAKANRDVRLLLLDLRCHGESAARFGFHPPHDLAAAASDVADVIRSELGGAAPHLVVGLSLGGKVALQLLKQMVAEQEAAAGAAAAGAGSSSGAGSGSAAQHMYAPAPRIDPPEDHQRAPGGSQAASATGSGSGSESEEGLLPPLTGLPQQVWVLDSQPGSVPLGVDAPTSVHKIIKLVNEVPTPLPSRQALYRFLEAQGIPLPVAQWLGTSLTPGGRYGTASSGNGNGSSNGSGSDADQKLDWQFDIQGAAALYNSYRLSSYWDVVTRPPPGTVLHLLRGELSDRWTPDMLRQLEGAAEAWRSAAAEAPEGVGQIVLHTLARAGHWVQADNPDGLHATMLPHFRDLRESHLQW